MLNRIAWQLRYGSSVVVIVLVVLWSIIIGTAVYACFA